MRSESSKPPDAPPRRTIKRSVALVIRDPDGKGLLLAVRRPEDDEDLPGVWGLPAGTLGPAESWEDAVVRSAREKLGVDVRLGRVLAEGSAERAAYTLRMRLYEARMVGGEPQVDQPVPGATRYADWKWAEMAALRPAAELGSLCSRLLLEVAIEDD